MIIKHPRLLLFLLIIFFVTTLIVIFLVFNHYQNYAGKYDPFLNIEIIYGKNYSLADLEFIGIHESSHKIWFNDISKEDINKYITIFNDSNIFVSDYAKTNAAEDFADTIAYNTHCEFDITTVPDDRQEFFKNLKMKDIVKTIQK